MVTRLAKINGTAVDLLGGFVDPGTLIDGNFQSYRPAGSAWSAYTGMWGYYQPNNDQLIATSSLRVYGGFPNGTVINWNVSHQDSRYLGLNGYLHVDYGNYDNSPGAITPKLVSALTACSLNVNWTFSGDASSGLLSEIWLASASAASGVFTKLFEVGFLPKMSAGSLSYAQGAPAVGTGTFTTGGVTWKVGSYASAAPRYIVCYRQDLAAHQGALPYLQLLQFLVTSGMITGNEWVNGIAFGVEPLTGAGSLTLTSITGTVA